jgi:hypothetical protein
LLVQLRYSNPRTIPPGLLIRSGYFTFVWLDYKRNERKRKPKVSLEQKTRIRSRGEVRFRSVYGAQKQINATTRHRWKTSEEACGNYNAPGVFTASVIKQNRRAREICAEARARLEGSTWGWSFPIVEIVGAKARPRRLGVF